MTYTQLAALLDGSKWDVNRTLVVDEDAVTLWGRLPRSEHAYQTHVPRFRVQILLDGRRKTVFKGALTCPHTQLKGLLLDHNEIPQIAVLLVAPCAGQDRPEASAADYAASSN